MWDEGFIPWRIKVDEERGLVFATSEEREEGVDQGEYRVKDVLKQETKGQACAVVDRRKIKVRRYRRRTLDNVILSSRSRRQLGRINSHCRSLVLQVKENDHHGDIVERRYAERLRGRTCRSKGFPQ
jgi:hypothetical protein